MTNGKNFALPKTYFAPFFATHASYSARGINFSDALLMQ
jgi:hypothetical protein